MQKDLVVKQLIGELEELRQHAAPLDQNGHLTAAEAEKFLQSAQNLTRLLAVYSFLLKDKEIASDLQVHLKIMENVSNKIDAESDLKTQPAITFEIQEEVQLISEETNSSAATNESPTRKLEISINDKYRIINELFGQNQSEFNAAVQQLNAMTSWDSTKMYLNSLKSVYGWKDDNPLVKSFYSMNQSRF